MSQKQDPSQSSHFITAPDGLKLHVRQHGPRFSAALPVICLPGLTRTCADFDVLAQALATDAERPRRVVALDYRGRGRSGYDRDPRNYDLAVELSDILAVLTGLEIDTAVFVGTSRGGILSMMLASARPTAVAAVVLNDIGPVIEVRGLVRIKSYVGTLPIPNSFKEGAELMRRIFGSQFPKLSPDEWLAFSQRSFKEKDGKLAATYDPKLAKALEGIHLQRSLPPLWKDFDALSGVPVMVIRGANSDVLSAATVEAMSARRPDLETIEVPDQGHAPLLVEDEIVGRIGSFIARCDNRIVV